jgi:hypothetical protein
MTLLADIPFHLDAARLMHKARLSADQQDQEEFCRLLALATQLGRPKAVYQEAFVEERLQEGVVLNGFTFHSVVLAKNLAAVERVFAFVATCGAELDQAHKPDGDMVHDYWWDVIKAAMLESAWGFMRKHLTEKFDLQQTASMSPGSGDAEIWPIEQQQKLFALLGDVQSQAGVVLTDSSLMIPNKSISGILFSTTVDFRTCRLCHRRDCPSRSAEFDAPLWESVHEDANQAKS